MEHCGRQEGALLCLQRRHRRVRRRQLGQQERSVRLQYLRTVSQMRSAGYTIRSEL